MHHASRQFESAVCYRLKRARAAVWLCAGLWWGIAGIAAGQESLIDHDPYDQVTLDEENGGAVLKVMPIELPKRIVPAKPNPDDSITIRLFAKPDKEYEVEWKHIAKVELFEDLVLIQAEKLVADEKYDEAFDYYAYLQRKFPNMPKLAASRQKYLFSNATGLARQKRFAESLALFEELQRIKPDFEAAPGRPLLKFIEVVADRLTGDYVEQKDFLSARRLLVRLGESYGEKLAAMTSKWQTKLKESAQASLAGAAKDLAAGQFRSAQDQLRTALAQWPAVEGGGKLSAEINAAYPMVWVGVTRALSDKPSPPESGWAAQRRKSLVGLTVEKDGATAAGYRVAARTAGEVRAVIASEQAGEKTQPREFAEIYFADTAQAVRALRHGTIDVVEQVYPADVPALKRDKTVLVFPYSQPTVHLLVPNGRRPLTSSRTFRRALEYGLDRQAILDRVVLGGVKIPGSRLITAPFAAGLADEAAGGYDNNIKPRSFDPREAIALAALAQQQNQGDSPSAKEGKASPQGLVLVHAADEVSRYCSQAIARQLAVVGVTVQTKALPVGMELPADENWDLAYVAVPGGAPLAAVQLLIGENGLAANSNPVLQSAVRRAKLEESAEGAKVRLKEVHRLAYDDLAVIPLWQVVEHYVVRPRVTGLDASRASLYENVGQIVTSPEQGRE